MVYGRSHWYHELVFMDVNGVYKPTYNWGAPSCRMGWSHPLWSLPKILQVQATTDRSWICLACYTMTTASKWCPILYPITGLVLLWQKHYGFHQHVKSQPQQWENPLKTKLKPCKIWFSPKEYCKLGRFPRTNCGHCDSGGIFKPPGPSFANIPRKRWPQGLKKSPLVPFLDTYPPANVAMEPPPFAATSPCLVLHFAGQKFPFFYVKKPRFLGVNQICLGVNHFFWM